MNIEKVATVFVLRRLLTLSMVRHVEFAVECLQELGVPGLSLVNPELAEILRGYKNALDAALMATRLISSSQGSVSGQAPLPPPQPMTSRRYDTIEVDCSLQFLLFYFNLTLGFKVPEGGE